MQGHELRECKNRPPQCSSCHVAHSKKLLCSGSIPQTSDVALRTESVDEPPTVKDAEEVRVTAEIHPEPVDKCMFCQSPRSDHGEVNCPYREEGLVKLGLKSQQHIEPPAFATFSDTNRRPTSTSKQGTAMSDCPACPQCVPHDPERCQLVQGSKWTENGAEDVAQSPRQELQLLPTPSTVSPTWPEEFDVAPLPVKSDKITILKRPASAPRKSYSQALKETHWKSLEQRKAEYDQARIRILGSAEPKFDRRRRRWLRK